MWPESKDGEEQLDVRDILQLELAARGDQLGRRDQGKAGSGRDARVLVWVDGKQVHGQDGEFHFGYRIRGVETFKRTEMSSPP